MVDPVQSRICEISQTLRGNPSARVAQQAVEALTVLPVHALLSDTDSGRLAKRIHRYLARHGMALQDVGFKQYRICLLREVAADQAAE